MNNAQIITVVIQIMLQLIFLFLQIKKKIDGMIAMTLILATGILSIFLISNKL